MMVSERQKDILNALVHEYVATAEPVSSGELVRKYRLPYSPATVRNEFFALNGLGFIEQPHTSAGRIPTDRGYRFFIENQELAERPERKIEQTLRPLADITDEFEFLRQASRAFAHLSGEFSMAGFSSRGIFYKSGLAEVLDDPEFADEGVASEFGELIDSLDEEIRNFFGEIEFLEPRAFIGEENPIREAREYTMLVSRAHTPFGEEGTFAILGPRRMDYAKNLRLLRTAQRIFNTNF